MSLRWKLQLRSDADEQVRYFINQYITSSKEIPVLLHAKIANITISDQQLTFHDLEARSYIKGIGSRFVKSIDAHPALDGLLKNSIDFTFKFGVHSFVVF